MNWSPAVSVGRAVVLLLSAVGPLAAQEQAQRVATEDTRALLDAGLYDEAETSAHARLEIAHASYGDDSLEVANAADLFARALIVNGRATSDETLALARRAVRNKEIHLGLNHPDLATSLLNLGDLLARAGEFPEAITLTERAVALREPSTPSGRLDLAEALDHLGATLSVAGQYDQALNVLERSVGMKETALTQNDATTVARTLEEIGLAYQRKGLYDRASAPLRRAAAIQETANTSHPAYAHTLNLIAQQLWFEGRLLESKNASERAVNVAERTLRPDHPIVAESLRYLAATLSDLGDLERAVRLKDRALSITERNFGPDTAETATYLHSLASAEFAQGAYGASRGHFQRALRIFEARYGPSHEFVAASLLMLARADASLGDYAASRRERSRAINIYEHVHGPNHPYVANALMELANVYRQQGALMQALPLVERALAIREKSLGPDHRDVARTLADMAFTLVQMGQSTRAQAAATRAVDIWERLQTPDAPEYATALALYGDVQARRGNYAVARDYYEKAIAIRTKVFGLTHPTSSEVQAALALSFAKIGDRGAALNNAVSAEAAGRNHLRMMLRSLAERQSLNYAAVRPRGLDLVLSLAPSTADAVLPAIDGVIRARALVLDEMAARQHSLQTASETTDPLRMAFTATQQRLANLTVRGPDQLLPAQYAALLEDARREAEQAEQALAEKSAEFRAERDRAQLGLDEVKAALPADAALVSFVRYDRTVFPTRPSARSVSSYLAFVLRADRPPAVLPLGSARTIDALVSQWRADIASEASAPAPGGSATGGSQASGAALRKRVWDPVSPMLASARRVFIVPDGTLSLVPFVALPIGQSSFLLERAPVIHYLSSERDLVTSGQGEVRSGGLLAIGGPAFDNVTTTATNPQATLRAAEQMCGGLQGIRFQPLAGALQEVNEISRVWNAYATSTGGTASASVLVGRAASETAFKQQAANYRVLHLATHGFFLTGDCVTTASAGTRAVGGLAMVTAPTRPVDNPLLLSGLALAGANRRRSAAPDADDGILTAQEVASLNLGGVEWAVLSACDTAVGEIKNGEGVLGLRRAFQVAGAHTVIMSLWSVDDQATRAWMRALYEARFAKQLSTDQAVHQASLALLKDRRSRHLSTNPFYWAAFVAAGDWR
jgi:CHAT domain-containing protein/tetratricopeptide (TPR) repeat protein